MSDNMAARKIKNKKSYLIVMLILLVIASICGIIAIRKYMDPKREERLFWVTFYNSTYREVLEIKGKYNVSVDGVEYMNQKYIDIDMIYKKIAFIRVFNPESEFNYDDVPTLLKEYDLFCETGDNSEMLDKFDMDDSVAMYSTNYSYWEISQVIDLIQEGDIYISNNEVVRVENDSSKFDEAYLQMVDSVNGDEGLAACMYYEKHSDLLNAWLKETRSALREVND